MAVATVTFNGTRLNDSDTNTGWGNYNTGGGAPSSESANAYQVSTGTPSGQGVVGKKVNSTASRIGIDYNGTAVDYTNAANRLFFCKVYVSDGFDLNTTWGVEVAVGSGDTASYKQYNLAGTGANIELFSSYPSQGGYIITAIDPTISQWAEANDVNGTFNAASVSWYALGAQFVNGFAKAENVAFDAIDYGTGLTVTGGTGADPDSNFTDFLDFDQDIRNNRYGVVTGRGVSITARGILSIGTSAADTVFTDTSSIVTFPDAYIGTGLCGVNVDISRAGNIIQLDSTIISSGKETVGVADTRADLTVTGTAGTFNSAANLRNFRNITLTSACTLSGADISYKLLDQASAVITDSVLKTNSDSGVAATTNVSFGTTTGIHDVTFLQTGSGHALTLDVGTYSFTNIKFSGYNAANNQNDSAIYVPATTGTVTINVLGGDTPSFRTGGATVNIVNAVSVEVDVVDITTNLPLQDARVYIKAAAGGDLTEGTVILSALTDVNGTAQNSGFAFTNDQPIVGYVRKSSTPPYYKQGSIVGTITSTGFKATIPMTKDE